MGSSPDPCHSVCRMCLAVDVPTVLLSESPLQAIFENVLNTSLHTHDMRPVEACLLCYSQLKKSWRLIMTSEKSENILTEISGRCNKITKESIALIDRNMNGLNHSLSIKQLECTDNLLPEQTGDIKIEIKIEREEPPLCSLHTEDVDISDIDMREYDSDKEDDLPLKTFSTPAQGDVKVEFTISQSEDAPTTSAQKSEIKVENEIEIDEIGIVGKSSNSTNTNERESPMHLLKPFKKTYCSICEQWYPNKYMEKHLMTHTDKRPFECKVCKKKFRLIHHLRRHMETVHTDDEKLLVVRNKTYTCDICSRKFQNKKDCHKHYKTHTYICDYCRKPYQNKAYLIQHLKIHTGEKIFECQMCHVQFNNMQHLNKHSRVSHNITTKKSALKNQTYRCTMCVSIFYNRRDYFKHLRTHTYECNDCHQTFKNKGYLMQHIRIHSGEYQCIICHMRFQNQVFLSRHTRLIHNVSIRKKVVRNHRYTCGICGSKFYNKKVFYKHTRIHRYKCDHCQKEYKNKPCLIQHLNIHMKKKQYECSICHWRFKSEVNMSRHIKSHEQPSEKMHECEFCQRRYNLESDLMTHLKTHTSEKPFECDICQRRYTSKNLLRRHHAIHTREKTLECEYCHKLFATNLQLSYHKRSHTGEKPYECSVCQRKFAFKNALTIHFRTHTGQKPYECKLCPARYADRSGLRLHLRKHTGEELPLKCDLCELRFAKKSRLVEHYRKHTGEKPFTCTLCDGRFVATRTLNEHLRSRVCSKSLMY